MGELVLVVGVVVQAVLWRVVALGKLPFWPTVTATDAVLGAVALAAGTVTCCADVEPAPALLVGAVSGLVLFGATRLVLGLAAPRIGFVATAVEGVYRRSAGIGPVGLWAVTALVIVPGEELFWRGLALPELQEATSVAVGAVLTWAVAAATIVLWGDASLLAAAVVGGALWTGLGVWSGGVLAPLASHLLWTGLMIAWPPPMTSGKVGR